MYLNLGGSTFSKEQRAASKRQLYPIPNMAYRNSQTVTSNFWNGHQVQKVFPFLVISMAGTEMSFGLTRMTLDALNW